MDDNEVMMSAVRAIALPMMLYYAKLLDTVHRTNEMRTARKAQLKAGYLGSQIIKCGEDS